jgi:hypothetical protein
LLAVEACPTRYHRYSKAMRPKFALTACITTLAVAVVPTLVPAQTPEPGRIAGRVTDRQGSELPNVQVTL